MTVIFITNKQLSFLCTTFIVLVLRHRELIIHSKLIKRRVEKINQLNMNCNKIELHNLHRLRMLSEKMRTSKKLGFNQLTKKYQSPATTRTLFRQLFETHLKTIFANINHCNLNAFSYYSH